MTVLSGVISPALYRGFLSTFSELSVALIAGPMYDSLYDALPEFTRSTGVKVNIAFHGAHAALNAHLASVRNPPYHLVSTHTKYAPSQRHLLAPVPHPDLFAFYPSVLEMARMDGQLYGLPRNIDAKLLHYRTDLVTRIPHTWDELVEAAKSLTQDGLHGYVFTGQESGLFGIFFELAEMAGARLFPEDHLPKLTNEGGRWALETIRNLYQSGRKVQIYQGYRPSRVGIVLVSK